MFKYQNKIRKRKNKNNNYIKNVLNNNISLSGWTSQTKWIVKNNLKSVKNISNNTFKCSDEYTSKENVKIWKNALNNCSKLNNLPTGIQIIENPFQITVIQKFLKDESLIEDLLDDIYQIDWNIKNMDLYELYQSVDLSTTTLPYLKDFYTFLTKDIAQLMTSVTGYEITRVSATCSMYNSTNYLLPHDDLVGDRLIAFVFYLSPWKLVGDNYTDTEKEIGWAPSMGGQLQLFGSDNNHDPTVSTISIAPANNQFLFFKVNHDSHHQVTEVVTDDYSRITINGWFHGPKAETERILNKIPETVNNFSSDDFNIDNWINAKYCASDTVEEINKYFAKQSEISLPNFFLDDKFNIILNILQHDDVNWSSVGPVNKRKYEVANIDKLTNFFACSSFLKLLMDYTKLDLCDGQISSAKNKTIHVELQRWSSGCYTIIHDAENYNVEELDVIIYLGCEKDTRAGIIHYLDVDEGDPRDHPQDDVLLSLFPNNNALNLVYRTSGTIRFTKYINHKLLKDNDYFYIIVAKYREII